MSTNRRILTSSISSIAASAALCLGFIAAAPAAHASEEPAGQTIVSLGDSFISGEGAMYANKHFEGGLYKPSVGLATVTAGSDVLTRTKVGTESLLTTNGPFLGDTVYEAISGEPIGVVKKVDSATKVTLTAPAQANYSGPIKAARADSVAKGFPYSGTPSIWQTAPGTITGTNPQSMTNWNSIYGDANGFPETGGQQTLASCARSFSAPGNIGEGWTHVNLACSGAVQPSVKHAAVKNGQFGTSFDVFKPGIDFMNERNGAATNGTALVPADYQVKGQAQLLKEYAQSHDVDVVAVSIGGNDFGFAPLIIDCALNFATNNLLGKNCDPDKSPSPYLNDANLTKVRTAVRTAILNIDAAMTQAGKDPGSYRIIFQDPPLPIGGSENNLYAETIDERQSLGGCGFKNKALDWIHDQLYPALVEAMNEGLVSAKEDLPETPIVHLVTKDAFKNHLLCGKDTKSVLEYPTGQAGRNPEWSDENGKKTEWVNFMSYSDQISNNYSMKALPIHPNYWGQRALAACMSYAAATPFVNGNLDCQQDPSAGLDDQGRPAMRITKVTPLSGDTPFVSGRPTISGDGLNPGDTLTAEIGEDVFTPAADYSYEYQWLRNGSPITGADQGTYTLTQADAKATIAVEVSANGAKATSAPVGPVASTITVDGSYTLAGTARVGETLTVDDSQVTVVPADADVAYEWLRDGAVIDGADAVSYALTGDDLGHEIVARLTLSATDAPDLVVDSDPAGPIEAGTMSSSGAPTIAGTATVGTTLTASATPVKFTPAADRVSFQWLRDNSPIPGATGETYTLSGDDYQAEISVKAVGHALGYEDATSQVSTATTPVGLGTLTIVGEPTFTPGQPQVGRPVRVSLDGVFSAWAARPTIVWKVNGTVVADAHGAEYTPTESDLDKDLTAEITPDALGYSNPAQPASVTAKVTKLAPQPVVNPATGQSQRTAISGNPVVGMVLTAKAPQFDGVDAPMSYQWLRGGVPITGATTATYRVRVADAGKKLTVRAIVAATPVSLQGSSESSSVTGAKTASKSTAKVTVSKRKATVTVTVTATGVPAGDVTGTVAIKVGKTVKATVKVVRGKAVAKVAVKRGRAQFTAEYKGSAGLKPSTSKPVTVKVK